MLAFLLRPLLCLLVRLALERATDAAAAGLRSDFVATRTQIVRVEVAADAAAPATVYKAVVR